MASYPQKMFFREYAGKPTYFIEQFLNIRVEGSESFQIPGKSRPARTASLLCLEGLAACLMGHVKEVYFDAPATSEIYCSISAESYSQSHVMKTTAIPVQDRFLAGTNGTSIIYSSFASTSTKKSANQGKCELSIFPVMLLHAMRAYTAGNQDAEPVLALYRQILQELKVNNALPINTATPPLQNAPALKELILKAADACYEWISYFGPLERANAPQAMTNWDFQKMPSPMGMPAQRPAVPILLVDSGAFDSFMSSNQLPAGSSNAPTPPPTVPPTVPAQAPTTPQTAPAPQPAPAQQPAPVPKKATPKFDEELKKSRGEFSEIYLRGLIDAKYLRMPKGGSPAILLQGPAGTGKTTAIRIIQELDRMPTTRISCSSETDISLLLGSYQKDHKGHWQPKLGVLAQVVRSAMLEALCVALEKGGSPGQLHAGQPICQLLLSYSEAAAKPGVKEKVRERFLAYLKRRIDQLATPLKPEIWEWVEEAYFSSGAAEAGCTRRVFLDEIHDAVTNKPLSHLLKVLLEDDRCLLLATSDIGGMNLYAYNVQFIGAGNPKPGYSFEQAVTSRFALTFSVGYPSENEVIKRIISNSKKIWAVQRPVTTNVSQAAFKPAAVRTFEVPPKLATAAERFGIWTRSEYKLGNLGGLLDPRGAEFLASHATFLTEALGMTPKAAFSEACTMQLDRIAELDDLGLPLQTQTEKLKQQADQLALNL